MSNHIHHLQAFKSNQGYNTMAPSENEAAFPLAYNILIHKEAVYQLTYIAYIYSIVLCLIWQAFKSNQGYHTMAASENEAAFPLAYNILVHKDSVQIERLLRAIYRPQNVYCIHMDSKSKEDFRDAIQGMADCFDNVFVASKLERIVYAGYSRLQADINCMQDQVREFKEDG